MEVTNLTSTTYRYDERRFQVELSDGTRWEARNIRQSALGSGDLRPTESARGWITYEVPMDPRLSAIVWRADSRTILVMRIPNFPK